MDEYGAFGSNWQAFRRKVCQRSGKRLRKSEISKKKTNESHITSRLVVQQHTFTATFPRFIFIHILPKRAICSWVFFTTNKSTLEHPMVHPCNQKARRRRSRWSVSILVIILRPFTISIRVISNRAGSGSPENAENRSSRGVIPS